MPRRARLRIAGYPLHVVQRGNNRDNCFWTPAHRHLYLCLLDEYAPVYECAVHAYVLMTNHVHLLFTPAQPDSASRLMKRVGQLYTQYVNRKLGRSGSLWEGRFRSSIVDSESYLLRCYRYIELNPVRAAMVDDVALHPWSSHRCNALGHASTIISPHERYLQLGTTPEERRTAYRALFDTSPTPEELRRIRDSVNGGYALGTDEFLARLERLTGMRAGRLKSRPETARVPRNGTSGLSPV